MAAYLQIGMRPAWKETDLAWHRTMAPIVQIAGITSNGLALSRLKHGFESRWGHQFDFVEIFRSVF